MKTPIGGKIATSNFSDGQVVQKGELLIVFDTRQALSQLNTLTRLIKIEEANLENRLSILEARKKVLSQKLETSKTITEELQNLVSSGAYQRIQYLQQLDSLLELQNDVKSLEIDISYTKLEASKAIDIMTRDKQDAELQLQYQNLYSPVDGIIFNSQANPGGVFQPGQTLLSIVPQDKLNAIVNVPNKDIGFITKGQKAKIRVDAYPFAKYGELSGIISYIGADALPPSSERPIYSFPVTITLDNDKLVSKDVSIPLRSGMTVSVNLKLRDKPVISILSDIFVNQTDSIRALRQ